MTQCGALRCAPAQSGGQGAGGVEFGCCVGAELSSLTSNSAQVLHQVSLNKRRNS